MLVVCYLRAEFLLTCCQTFKSTLTPLMIDESKPSPTSSSKQSSPSTVPSKRSEMLCMIGIPANVGCNELLDFIMPFK